MKEATGELSMVVITIVAVVAILILWNTMSPVLSNWVGQKFGQITDSSTNSNADTCAAQGKTYNAAKNRCE